MLDRSRLYKLFDALTSELYSGGVFRDFGVDSCGPCLGGGSTGAGAPLFLFSFVTCFLRLLPPPAMAGGVKL